VQDGSSVAPHETNHDYPDVSAQTQASEGDVPRDASFVASVDTDSTGKTAVPDSGTDRDAERQRRVSGDGLPDDNARVADLDEDAVEQGLWEWMKQAVARTDRTDRPDELTGIIDRPDFQDPQADSRYVPDRYGTPLERADGTRTPLFDGEPTREQTQQGALGDCGIIAALGAVAGHRPEAIRDCVREADDGNYEVRLHEAKYSAAHMRYEPTGRPITFAVTPDLPVFDSDPDKPAFADSTRTNAAWAPVLEKAIAGKDQTWDDERHQKWNRLWNARGNAGDGPKGYVRLNQGSTPGERAEVLTQLTGRPAKTLEFPSGYDNHGRSSDKRLLDELRGQLADRNPVLVGTRSLGRNDPPLVKDLRPSHAYEVTKVDDQGRLHLRNPWNRRHPQPLTIGEFKASVRPRYTTLEQP
jgi:hypothetical protein